MTKHPTGPGHVECTGAKSSLLPKLGVLGSRGRVLPVEDIEGKEVLNRGLTKMRENFIFDMKI